MLLYSLQLSNGSPFHPNPTMICFQPELSLSHTLPSLGSSKWALFLTHKHATLVHVWIPITLSQICVQSCLHDLGFLWHPFPDHPCQSCSSTFHTSHPISQCTVFKTFLFCIITSSFIGLHVLCLGFPTGLWALERQKPFLSCWPLYALCLYIIGSEWIQESKSM